MNPTYWFFEWLDDSGIGTFEQFQSAIQDPNTLELLRQKASEHLDHSPLSLPDSIAAASDLDLSGELSCRNVACRIAQVEQLFRRAWFYFDSIIISDTITPQLAREDGASEDDDWLQQVLDSARVLFHLKDMGAAGLVAFERKLNTGFCEVCADAQLAQRGLGGLLKAYEQYVDEFTPDATIRTSVSRDGSRSISVRHPLMNNTHIWDFAPDEKDDIRGILQDRLARAHNHGGPVDLETLIAQHMVRSILEHLVIDVSVANTYNASLGTTHPMYQRLMSGGINTNPESVAFELALPVLSSVPIETLIEIRNDEREPFLRFRDGLRRAIKERLSQNEADHTSIQVANQIREDLIEPELRAITQRLKKADDALYKKSGVALGVGALLTTCGLATGFIPAAAVGIATLAGGLVVPAQQHIDKRAEIESSDIFFIWRATRHTVGGQIES